MTRQITKSNKIALLQLSDDLQDKFISFVHDRVGILIKRGHKELLKNISEACDIHHHSPHDYLEQLYKADENSEILNKLVAAITIGETYFFRDKRQIKWLKNYILPKIIQHKMECGDKTLRIWSAGCSSGEEIYTIIMLLNDLIVNVKDWKCNLLATDININSLRKGMNGKYSQWSMRSITESYLDRYFRKGDGLYTLEDSVRRMVKFDYLNLNSDSYPSIMNGTAMQDLIICRNVLIYFDNDHIKKILSRLTKCMSEDGYILLGASDPIALMESDVRSVSDCPSLFTKIVPSRAMSEGFTQCCMDAMNKPRDDILDVRDDTSEINELIAREKWSDAILKIDQYSMIGKITVSQMVAKATALANLGKTADAINICEEVISMNKMNEEVYFIYALSLAELNRNKEAENAFRNALYINPNFLICRYQLGLFLLHHKRNQEGLKALESTIKTASLYDENEIVPDSKNMSYKELVLVLKNEIALHKLEGI